MQPHPPVPLESLNIPLPEKGWYCLDIRTTEEITLYLEYLNKCLESAGFNRDDLFAIRLSMEEGLLNSIRHGHHFDPSKSIHIRHHITTDRLLAVIEDEGTGFNPHAIPDPLASENLEREGGLSLIHI